ncbi:hypothetical protein LCGC14_0264660 [marine sediment metagenome]|uniref:Uncharacterized protein n=1 Tax=marine sediment metagenome TaxID=412755 RepID=A0A0F9X5R6_9ZZZZ
MTIFEGFGVLLMFLFGIYVGQALRFRREDKLRRERGK